MWSSGESAFVQINCGYDFTFFKLVRLLASKVIDFTLMDHIILNTAGLFLRNFKLSSTCSFTADLKWRKHRVTNVPTSRTHYM